MMNNLDDFKLRLDVYIKENYKKSEKEVTIINTFNKSMKDIHFDGSPKMQTYGFITCPNDVFNNMEPSFQSKLFKLIDQKNLSDVDVYKKSNIDRRLFSKIRSDLNYQPSKSTVILFCFGLELDVDTALDLLKSCGYTFSNSNKQDVIVKFYLLNKNYDLMDLNLTLYKYDLKTLF